MKLLIKILPFILLNIGYGQRPGTAELINKFDVDTIYVYLPMYNKQENMEISILCQNCELRLKRKIISYVVQDSLVGRHRLGFYKGKYMDFDERVADMKLIDTLWIKNNQDKILYPEIFEKYQFIEILSFIATTKAVYIIEEENFFGDKVYARETKLSTDYSYEE
jgi:hypothetical protein